MNTIYSDFYSLKKQVKLVKNLQSKLNNLGFDFKYYDSISQGNNTPFISNKMFNVCFDDKVFGDVESFEIWDRNINDIINLSNIDDVVNYINSQK